MKRQLFGRVVVWVVVAYQERKALKPTTTRTTTRPSNLGKGNGGAVPLLEEVVVCKSRHCLVEGVSDLASAPFNVELQQCCCVFHTSLTVEMCHDELYDCRDRQCTH